jgi:hypothetical protein
LYSFCKQDSLLVTVQSPPLRIECN